MKDIFRKIQQLQWDDHRYYHQCRINQTLHLISAISFLVAYVFLFVDPSIAGVIGWLVGMVTRQSGHIFFEPRGFDSINGVSYEYKESIKAGYNMGRKGVLIAVWLSLPPVLAVWPSLGGLIEPVHTFSSYLHEVGLLWLALGVAGLMVRSLHLCFLRDPSWALAWVSKILLDPFHNIATYWNSPLALLQGQRLDPLLGARQDQQSEATYSGPERNIGKVESVS